MSEHKRIIKEDYSRYCVYRLLDKDKNILYIGKSKQLKTRIANHLREKSNLPKQCVNKICFVEYLEFENECDMDLFEIYAISYYNPPYNKEYISNTGIIKIKIPNIWNELDINTLERIEKIDIIKTNVNTMTEDILFNKDAFLNEELSIFLEKHYNNYLTNSEYKELADICDIPQKYKNKINIYIGCNNSKAELIYEEKRIKLIKRKNSRSGYGSLRNRKIREKNYLVYRIPIEGKIHDFYGKNRIEIADKVIKYLTRKKLIIISNEEKENCLSYNEYNLDDIMLSKDEIMKIFHLKDSRSYNKLIDEEKMPYFKLGRNTFTPKKNFEKWIENKMINNI